MYEVSKKIIEVGFFMEKNWAFRLSKMSELLQVIN